MALVACSSGSGPSVETTSQITAIPKKPWIAAFFANPGKAVSNGFRVVEEADPTVSAVPDPDVIRANAEVIRGGGRYQVGKPYEIAGKLYEPREDATYSATGRASWYGAAFHGRLTANGEIFDRAAITAAHPTLPLPSYVRVTNLNNDRSIVVRVNDRGPFKKDRLIDVSEQTAALLGFRRHGLTNVKVEYVAPAPLDGNDKESLLATYRGPPPAGSRVLLASASPSQIANSPIAANAFAFARDMPSQAASAIRRLTAPMEAAERIDMAFQAAEEAEE